MGVGLTCRSIGHRLVAAHGARHAPHRVGSRQDAIGPWASPVGQKAMARADTAASSGDSRSRCAMVRFRYRSRTSKFARRRTSNAEQFGPTATQSLTRTRTFFVGGRVVSPISVAPNRPILRVCHVAESVGLRIQVTRVDGARRTWHSKRARCRNGSRRCPASGRRGMGQALLHKAESVVACPQPYRALQYGSHISGVTSSQFSCRAARRGTCEKIASAEGVLVRMM